MGEDIIWAGLYTHKESISVAVDVPGRERPIEWRQGTTTGAVRKLQKKLLKLAEGREIRACFEAGPGGFWPRTQQAPTQPFDCRSTRDPGTPLR